MAKTTRATAGKTAKTTKRTANGRRPAPAKARTTTTKQPTVTLTEKRAKSSGPKLFVNFPVKDLKRSVAFFTKLGYKFNQQFTSEDATCMIISEQNYAMLLTEKFFQTFTTKPIADANKTVEALVALSCDSRKDVDTIVNKALSAGGRKYREAKDEGFMYSWGFEDPDGHIWEFFWMDPKALATSAQPQARAR